MNPFILENFDQAQKALRKSEQSDNLDSTGIDEIQPKMRYRGKRKKKLAFGNKKNFVEKDTSNSSRESQTSDNEDDVPLNIPKSSLINEGINYKTYYSCF
jgi:hypothetical protein